MVRESKQIKLKQYGRGGGFFPEPSGSSLTKKPSRPFYSRMCYYCLSEIKVKKYVFGQKLFSKSSLQWLGLCYKCWLKLPKKYRFKGELLK